jgi:hypothetical protein
MVTSLADFINQFQFKFDLNKDVPNLYVKLINLEAENAGLRDFIETQFSKLLNKPKKTIIEEVETFVDKYHKEFWASFASQRGE